MHDLSGVLPRLPSGGFLFAAPSSKVLLDQIGQLVR